MARQFKPGQLQTGSLYNISASYAVTASYAANSGTTFDTGSFTTTASFNAFTASYTTGSFTGSFSGNGSGLTGITSASYSTTASYALSSSYAPSSLSSSFATSASYALSASYAPPTFPYTGSALITGSLGITGSIITTDGTYEHLNTETKTLTDSFGITSINWENRTTNATDGIAGTFTSIDWQANQLYRSASPGIYSNIVSLDWTIGQTYNASGYITLDWNTGKLYKANSINTVDWENSNLKAPGNTINGSTAIDWANRILRAGQGATDDSNVALDWQNRKLYNFAGTTVLDWQNQFFTGSLHGTASWARTSLTASYVLQSVSSSFATTASYAITSSVSNITDSSDTNQEFYITFVANTGSTQIIRTDSNGLYNSKYNTLTVTSSFATTASYAAYALSASYAPPTFPYTGSAIISGSLSITGSLSVSSGSATPLNTAKYGLFDSVNNASIGWGSRQLFDAAAQVSVNWKDRFLYNNATSASVDWNSSFLLSNNQRVVRWATQQLYDTIPRKSVDWGTRELTNISGATILDWQTAQFTGTASYATQALSASWAPGGSPGGSDTYVQFNDSGSFSGIGGVTIDKNNRSLANGDGVVATGNYSHAEGEGTTANGYASHAEGVSTTAYGYASHTEGQTTQTGITTAYYADNITAGLVKINTTYGDQTAVFTQGSSLMYGSATALDNLNLLISGSYWDTVNTYVQLLDPGVDTAGAPTIVAVQTDGSYNDILYNAGDRLFIGNNSHAEGSNTIAYGAASHAEGYNTKTPGANSHAEGNETIAIGDYSHAEGAFSVSIGYGSHAEGNGAYTYADGSHAEGVTTKAGFLGYGANTTIASGVFELDPYYGDISSLLVPGNFVLIDDNDGEISGTPTVYKLEVASITYNATPATEITLVDSSINTATNKYKVGIYGDVYPLYANTQLGGASHAAGSSTQTYGYASNATGYYTEALGYYQTVVGQHNIPLSNTSSFIVGDGTAAGGRHNLLVAGDGVVQITGSMQLTGSMIINNYLNTAVQVTANSGATTIYTLPTASYDGAWFEYTARSGSNARAGQITSMRSGSQVNFSETTTTDFGSTADLSLGVFIIGANMALTASAATSGWTIKTIIRSI